MSSLVSLSKGPKGLIRHNKLVLKPRLWSKGELESNMRLGCVGFVPTDDGVSKHNVV